MCRQIKSLMQTCGIDLALGVLEILYEETSKSTMQVYIGDSDGTHQPYNFNFCSLEFPHILE